VFAAASLYDHLLGLGQHSEFVEFGSYLATMCAHFEESYGLPAIDVRLVVSIEQRNGLQLGIDTCTTVGTVVNELVANAAEHAFAARPGTIQVAVRRGSAALIVEVSDDGAGYSAAAKESTGLRTARRLVERLGATLDFNTREAHGTRWTLSLPLA
jgi:two-component sensor histidine kinase